MKTCCHCYFSEIKFGLFCDDCIADLRRELTEYDERHGKVFVSYAEERRMYLVRHDLERHDSMIAVLEEAIVTA